MTDGVFKLATKIIRVLRSLPAQEKQILEMPKLNYNLNQLLLTCATVCSPKGSSSFRKSTLFCTDAGSASRIILQMNKFLTTFL